MWQCSFPVLQPLISSESVAVSLSRLRLPPRNKQHTFGDVNSLQIRIVSGGCTISCAISFQRFGFVDCSIAHARLRKPLVTLAVVLPLFLTSTINTDNISSSCPPPLYLLREITRIEKQFSFLGGRAR